MAESYSAMMVYQLKALLKEHGLTTSGVKQDLVARLVQADAEAAGCLPLWNVFVYSFLFFQSHLSKS